MSKQVPLSQQNIPNVLNLPLIDLSFFKHISLKIASVFFSSEKNSLVFFSQEIFGKEITSAFIKDVI